MNIQTYQYEQFKVIFDEFKTGVIKHRYCINDFSITDFGLIVKESVALSYRDIQRALRSIGGFQAQKSAALEWLEQMLKSYFNASPVEEKEFNEWHKIVCDGLKSMLSCYKRGNDAGFTYGSAQKLINLAFKYMYCFDVMQNDRYIEYFRYCHIALDNAILKWLGMPEGVTRIDDYELYMCIQKRANGKDLPAPWQHDKLTPLERKFVIYSLV